MCQARLIRPEADWKEHLQIAKLISSGSIHRANKGRINDILQSLRAYRLIAVSSLGIYQSATSDQITLCQLQHEFIIISISSQWCVDRK